jgi:hypothetical protein
VNLVSTAHAAELKQAPKGSRSKRKLEQSGKTFAELQAVQQEKFRQARSKMAQHIQQVTTSTQEDPMTKKQKLEPLPFDAATSSSFGAL